MHRTLTPSLSWWPSLLATLAFALLAPVPGYPAGQVVETIERSFSVADHPTVVVRNVDGRTQIAAGSERNVLVRAVKEVTRAGSKKKRNAPRQRCRCALTGSETGSRLKPSIQGNGFPSD